MPHPLRSIPRPSGSIRAAARLASALALSALVACGSDGSGGGEDPFDIELAFYGPALSTTERAAFDRARARWESILATGLGEARLSGGKEEGACAGGELPAEPALPAGTLIDDLLIHVAVAPVDGPGGTLASAGPCIVRSSDGLPAYGIMVFDDADLGDTLESTVLHEMGHVLGIGTVWDSQDLLAFEPDRAGDPCELAAGYRSEPEFTGVAATAEYEALRGADATGVPVEEDGAPGTRCGHWDEQEFDRELMTGYLDAGDDPLSEMTIASLEDLGYEVDRSRAEPFALPLCQGFCPNASADPDAPGGVDLAAGERLLRPIGAAPAAP